MPDDHPGPLNLVTVSCELDVNNFSIRNPSTSSVSSSEVATRHGDRGEYDTPSSARLPLTRSLGGVVDAKVDKGIPHKRSIVGDPYESSSSDECGTRSFYQATKSGHKRYCRDIHGNRQGVGESPSGKAAVTTLAVEGRRKRPPEDSDSISRWGAILSLREIDAHATAASGLGRCVVPKDAEKTLTSSMIDHQARSEYSREELEAPQVVAENNATKVDTQYQTAEKTGTRSHTGIYTDAELLAVTGKPPGLYTAAELRRLKRAPNGRCQGLYDNLKPRNY